MDALFCNGTQKKKKKKKHGKQHEIFLLVVFAVGF